MPCMDFETYSEAGYVFVPEQRKWASIVKSPPHGIGAVGAPVYAEHPSTEILSLAYDLGEARLWVPGMPDPVDLFAYLARGGLIEAWNAAFEFYIWHAVGVRKLGWPAVLDLRNMRDAMDKSRAFSLPGRLEDSARALRLPPGLLKDSDGHDIMVRVSKPRQPTVKNPSLRHTHENDPGSFTRLYAYNLQDLVAETAVSVRCPDLSAEEEALRTLNFEINVRGVHVDRALLDACRHAVDRATAKGTVELQQLTGGSVSTVDKRKQLSGWLAGRGCPLPSLEAESIEAALSRTDLPEDVRRVLQLRSSLGARSVKKLDALHRMMNSDGRIRDLYAYCGAERTGRFAGRGPQPQNLPTGGPDVDVCQCGAYHSRALVWCPYCGGSSALTSKGAEWCAEAMEYAAPILLSRDLGAIETLWGDPVALVSGMLRGLFVAAPGHDLVSSDYSAIEAVVQAMLSGEQWRIDVFRTHGKIYEMSAATMSGVPFEEIVAHKEREGAHHPLRKKGKVAELACFTHDTKVLTNRGYVNIKDVSMRDQLWDGVGWVKHGGVVYKGKKRILLVDGVGVTPRHPICVKGSWQEASKLASNASILCRALETGSETLPLLTRHRKRCGCSARVALHHTMLRLETFVKGKAPGAMYARRKKAPRSCTSNTSTNTRTLCRKTNTVVDFLTGCLRRSGAVLSQLIVCIKTMAHAVSPLAPHGFETKQISFGTSALSRGGITRLWRWIERTLIKGTSPGISGSLAEEKMPGTNGASRTCSGESTNLSDVYDIVDAGPRHRFTIKSSSGHLLVHNSGYQGWVGAWVNFGADKFMSEAEIKDAVMAWRDASPMIVAMWAGLEKAAKDAVKFPGQCFAYRDISYGVHEDVLYCLLPSGRRMAYHEPRISARLNAYGREVEELSYMGNNSDYRRGPVGWMRLETYGGKLFENVVQAVARDVFANGMLRVAAAGYPIVMHTHDEITAEVPHGFGSVEELEREMSTMPAWAADWPIKAKGGWRGHRYRK